MDILDLPLDIQMNMISNLDLDEINGLCTENSDWRKLCNQPAVRTLINQKREEQRVDELWTLIDDLSDLTPLEQLELMKQYNPTKLRILLNRYYKIYQELYATLEDFNEQFTGGVGDDYDDDDNIIISQSQPQSRKSPYPFENVYEDGGEEFGNFISYIISRGQNDYNKVLRNPFITILDSSYLQTKPHFFVWSAQTLLNREPMSINRR